jgi:copper chaperone NosL
VLPERRQDKGFFRPLHLAATRRVEHPGPKAQIFLAGRVDPLWFTQVRDAIAFTRLPAEPRDISAIWVNDMGRATNWEAPEAGAWADAREAWFVIASSRAGGMGAAEAVPFGTEPPARAFAAAHGGRVVRLAEIPDDYVLGWTPPLDDAPQPGQPDGAS